MGASMKATVLPGRAISWDGASATGWTTLTIGMAASWILFQMFQRLLRSRDCLIQRSFVFKPPHGPLCVYFFLRSFFRKCRARVAPGMQETENRGNENQRGHRGEEEAANYGAAQGGVLFASIAEAEGHGNHADDHGESGHEDGAEAGEAGFGGGSDWVSVVQEAFLGEGDDEDAIGGAHAHAHDRAHESRDAERGVGEEKKDDDAGEGGGERSDDDEGIEP